MGNLNCKKCSLYHPNESRLGELPNDTHSVDPVKTKSNRKTLTEFLQQFEKVLPTMGEYCEIPKEDIERYKTLKAKFKPAEIVYNKNSSVHMVTPIKFKDGNIYNGSWNDNFYMEGTGVFFINADKIIVEGRWENGELVYGHIYYLDGSFYDGEIKNSNYDGKGTFIYATGQKFEGNFSLGKKHGNGKLSLTDGSIYDGCFAEDLFNGKGIFTWNDGTNYNGDFIKGNICGTGILKNNNGESYEGEFKDNLFEGHGLYTWQQLKESYNGNYIAGKKQGFGNLLKSDGSLNFEGDFFNGLPHGRGNIKVNDKSFKSNWRNGKNVEIPSVENLDLKNMDNISLDFEVPKENLVSNRFPFINKEDEIVDLNTADVSLKKDDIRKPEKPIDLGF